MFFPLFLLLLCSFLLEFTQAQEVSAKLDQCTADPAACKGYIGEYPFSTRFGDQLSFGV
jgi:hypothetical protein